MAFNNSGLTYFAGYDQDPLDISDNEFGDLDVFGDLDEFCRQYVDQQGEPNVASGLSVSLPTNNSTPIIQVTNTHSHSQSNYQCAQFSQSSSSLPHSVNNFSHSTSFSQSSSSLPHSANNFSHSASFSQSSSSLPHSTSNFSQPANSLPQSVNNFSHITNCNFPQFAHNNYYQYYLKKCARSTITEFEAGVSEIMGYDKNFSFSIRVMSPNLCFPASCCLHLLATEGGEGVPLVEPTKRCHCQLDDRCVHGGLIGRTTEQVIQYGQVEFTNLRIHRSALSSACGMRKFFFRLVVSSPQGFPMTFDSTPFTVKSQMPKKRPRAYVRDPKSPSQVNAGNLSDQRPKRRKTRHESGIEQPIVNPTFLSANFDSDLSSGGVPSPYSDVSQQSQQSPSGLSQGSPNSFLGTSSESEGSSEDSYSKMLESVEYFVHHGIPLHDFEDESIC